ncbi:hypothetical protein BLL41_10160 [Bacillus sp. FMQ74]|nr:hypothetical protein BLL41_10160 [Bacillus sp. FMQ74]
MRKFKHIKQKDNRSSSSKGCSVKGQLFCFPSRFSDLQILIDKGQELAMIMLYNDNHFQL